jgi:O-antigen ligase
LTLSASRGGIIGLVLEFALLAYLSRAHRIGRQQLLAVVAIALVAGNFIVWLGISRAIQHFEQLTHGGISRELRVSIYKDTWQIFLDHPWVGTGLGTLVAVYPRYASFYNGLTVDHAHNDYLELLADTGIAGGLCGLSFIGLFFWRGRVGLQSAGGYFARAMIAGSLVACAGLLLHSLVDFNLHIPSNALIFLLLSCIATNNIAKETARPQRTEWRASFLRSSSFSARICGRGRNFSLTLFLR